MESDSDIDDSGVGSGTGGTGEQKQSRDEAIAEYISLTKKKKASIVAKGSRCLRSSKRKPQVDPLGEQLMIHIGKMYHCSSRGRGILAKEFTPVKLLFHKDCSYKRMVEWCRAELYPDGPADATYYIADSSGATVFSGELVIDKGDGTTSQLPWTLATYLKLSKMKYPSRAKFYCVQGTHGGGGGPSEGAGEQSTSGGPTSLSGPSGSAGEQSTSGGHTSLSGPSGSAGNRWFEPLFVSLTKSRYVEKFCFRPGITQDEALGWCLGDDSDTMHHVQDTMVQNPRRHILFEQNPCHCGFSFYGIRQDGNCIVNLIADLNGETGEVVYKQPLEGSQLKLWSGCFASPDDGVAVIACVPLEGYVPCQWERDGVILQGELYPVIYVTEPGLYSCTLKDNYRTFKVQGGARGAASVRIMPSSQHADLLSVKRLNVIGKGNFGTVYRAIWRGTLVAAKAVTLAQAVGTVAKEIETCRYIQHPNILSLLGAVEEGDTILIISNLVQGPNLHDLIFSGDYGKLSFASKLHLSVQICQAVTFLHTSSPPQAHLDIKPCNVLVEVPSYHVFLGDFGLSKVMTNTTAIGSKTMLAGTPGYQPPEQLRSESLGISCNVYAFGGVLLVLFGEKLLWEGMTPYQIIFKVAIENEKPATSHLSPMMQAICDACLSLKTSRPTIEQVLSALLEI